MNRTLFLPGKRHGFDTLSAKFLHTCQLYSLQNDESIDATRLEGAVRE